MTIGFDNKPASWAAVADCVAGENARATCYLEVHGTSIGTAREAILRELVRRHTPAPYEVASGFSHNPDTGRTTCQCDVLVHDPTKARPFFEAAGIVVAHRMTVKAAVEVKSDLDKAGWGDVLKVHQNFCWQGVPTFGFSFDGVTFDTFLGYLKEAMHDEVLGVPACVAVHSRNYVFVRGEYRGVKPEESRPRPADWQMAVNFGDATASLGMATATFIHSFLRHLAEGHTGGYFRRWIEGLQLPDGARVLLAENGEQIAG